MKKHLPEFIDLLEKNLTVCPWCSKKSSTEYFEFLKNEVFELETAIKNSDSQNIEEELGDVLWVTLTLILMCEREKIVQSDLVVSRVIKKFLARKPWLLSGEKVTSDQAIKIWNDAKKKEKEKKLS